jgi:DNA-directed RNA polymerase subunit RPC12/RpoP
MSDIPVQCTRCRNKHMESERKSVRRKNSIISDLVCPRCGCKSFYDMRPQVAWCWASGLIEFGDENEVPDGAIVIARGTADRIKAVVGVLARRGYGASAGKLLVPGVPEAENGNAAVDALIAWRKWCAEGNGRKGRYGVKFETCVS